MAQEIERKFLVKGSVWQTLAQGETYRQGYLSSTKERVVRVRTIGETGFLTIKGITTNGSRAEYEYKIPGKDADEMLSNLCERPLIEKKRYVIPQGDLKWEVDEFFGENKGLVVAEIELNTINQEFDKPDWIGEEVTEDPRYFNSNLSKKPYTQW